MTSTPDYFAQIDAARRALIEADFILIGAGAGLSAAAGLNYQDPDLFTAWYPQFAGLGYQSIWDAITHHWLPDDHNRRQFWAFWATHIQRIRYDAPAGRPYLDLKQLVKESQPTPMDSSTRPGSTGTACLHRRAITENFSAHNPA